MRRIWGLRAFSPDRAEVGSPIRGIRVTCVGPLGTERAHPPMGDRTSRYVISGMIRSATMFATLIIGLIAGPAVSL
jgi:hypothetical protein